MPHLLSAPVRIDAAGSPTKLIDEHVGLVSTPDGATEYVSVCLPAFSPARVNRAE